MNIGGLFLAVSKAETLLNFWMFNCIASIRVTFSVFARKIFQYFQQCPEVWSSALSLQRQSCEVLYPGVCAIISTQSGWLGGERETLSLALISNTELLGPSMG